MIHRPFRPAVWVLLALGLTSPTPAKEDCNRNRDDDSDDIAAGVSADSDADGIPDECELAPLPLLLFEGDVGLPGTPLAFLVADLDSDGLSDVVSVQDDGTGASVGVLRSLGGGTFTPMEVLEVGEGVVAAAALDWNRDGAMDLAISGVDAVHVLLNEGGGLGSPLELARPGGVVLAAADLTGDEQAELIVAAAGGLTVLRLFDGAVDSVVTKTGAASPAEIATADYDGDANLDVALVTRRENVLTLLHGRGDGSFGPARMVDLGGSGSRAVAAGDLDGDGDKDVVVGLRTSVRFLLNEGQEFAAPVAHSSGGSLTSVVLGDFDGDADLDLLSATALSNEIDVWQNAGDRPLFDTGALGAGWAPRRLSSGDFDGDGHLDVAAVVGNGEVARATVLLGYSTSPPAELRFRSAIVRVTGKPHSITGGDFNADGFFDVGTCNGSQASFSVLFGSSTGDLVTSRAYISPERASLQTVTSGDFDGDGDLDLAAGDAWSDIVPLRTNDGDGNFLDLSFVAFGSSPGFLTTGDVDGNGRLDLVSVSSGVSLVLNAGGGMFEAARELRVGSGPRAVVLRDLDGDGDEDLAVASANARELSVHLNEGDGTFPPGTSYPVLGAARHVVASDLEGRGAVDLIVAHDAWVTIFRNDGDGRFAEDLTLDTRQNPYSLLVTDVDSDGALDIVTANTINPAYGSLSVFLARGVREYSPPFRLVVGAEPRFAVAGDVDQDGDMDLVSANRTSETITLQRNEQSTFPDLEPEGQSFHRGDANADGGTNLVDAVAMATYLFRSGATPACLKSADLDDDGKVNLVDVIYLLSFLHRDGAAPMAPHRECGADDTEDALTCDSFEPCPQ
jgi:hypothetical protein